MQYENEARVFFTAKSENEGFARLFAAGFLTQLDPTISEMTDVKTAVSEADGSFRYGLYNHGNLYGKGAY